MRWYSLHGTARDRPPYIYRFLRRIFSAASPDLHIGFGMPNTRPTKRLSHKHVRTVSSLSMLASSILLCISEMEDLIFSTLSSSRLICTLR